MGLVFAKKPVEVKTKYLTGKELENLVTSVEVRQQVVTFNARLCSVSLARWFHSKQFFRGATGGNALDELSPAFARVGTGAPSCDAGLVLAQDDMSSQLKQIAAWDNGSWRFAREK